MMLLTDMEPNRDHIFIKDNGKMEFGMVRGT